MGRVCGVTIPLLVFEKFLAHGKLRDSWSSQEESRGESRATAGVPRARVGAVCECGYAEVTAGLHHVVIFHAGYGLPGVWEVLRKKIGGYSSEINESTLALRRLL